MLPRTRELFVWKSLTLEGYVSHMYLDIYGYVTTGVGNLIDSIPAAQGLPWKRKDGTPATQAEISAEWQRIKNAKHLAKEGWRSAAKLATLHLTEESVYGLVGKVMDSFLGILRSRFPDIDSWPQDAQYATLSMAWACGPWFRFGTLEKALRAREWALASASCHIDTDGPDKVPGTGDDNNGLKPRNAMNKILYRSAATPGLSRDAVHGLWTRDTMALQRALNALQPGVALAVDGKLGPKTKAALTAFQAQHALTADGIPGIQTWGKIDELLYP